MVRHIVWWTLNPETDGRSATENALRFKELAEGLMGKIPGLLSIDVATSLLPSSSETADVILCSCHESPEALKAYAVHPLHQEVGKFVSACAASRHCMDYEV